MPFSTGAETASRPAPWGKDRKFPLSEGEKRGIIKIEKVNQRSYNFVSMARKFLRGRQKALLWVFRGGFPGGAPFCFP